MLEAGDPADMFDMVRDLGQGGVWLRVGGFPVGLDAPQLGDVPRVQAAARGLGLEAGLPV